MSAFVNLAVVKPAFQSPVDLNGTADLAVGGDATKNYLRAHVHILIRNRTPGWPWICRASTTSQKTRYTSETTPELMVGYTHTQ